MACMLLTQGVTVKMSKEEMANLKDALKKQKGGGVDEGSFVEASLSAVHILCERTRDMSCQEAIQKPT